MKLRYQMRGLGIGIMITALLMGVATDNKIPLSDAEIKMRALELGMVESDSLKLSDIPQIALGSSGEDESHSSGAEGTRPESGGAPEPGEGSENEDDAAGGETDSGNESGAAGEADSGNESSGADGETAPGEEGDAVSGEADSGNESGAVNGTSVAGDGGDTVSDSIPVVIEGGATSYSVCQQLEQLGLVEDAVGFDDYLCGMGYSRSVREGTFYIAPGTSQEEIARIITGKR